MTQEEVKKDLEFKDFYKHKMDFIQKAIDDTQNTIRASDTKAAAVIGFWGLVFTILLRLKDDISIDFPIIFNTHVVICSFLIIIMFCFFIKSFILAYLVLVPKVNPNEHINSDGRSRNLYFLASFNKKFSGRNLYRVPRNLKLLGSTDTYMEEMKSITTEQLTEQLVLELQKVSFIRNVKLERVSGAITAIIQFLMAALAMSLYMIGYYLISSKIETTIEPRMNFELFVCLVSGHLIYSTFWLKKRMGPSKQAIYNLVKGSLYTGVVSVVAFLIVGYFNWSITFVLFFISYSLEQTNVCSWWVNKSFLLHREGEEDQKLSLLIAKQCFYLLSLFLISCFA